MFFTKIFSGSDEFGALFANASELTKTILMEEMLLT